MNTNHKIPVQFMCIMIIEWQVNTSEWQVGAVWPQHQFGRLVLCLCQAPYFSDNLSHEDLDEMNIEIMRNTLYKAYLDDFAAFCNSLGGATAEIMGDLLAFEVGGQSPLMACSCPLPCWPAHVPGSTAVSVDGQLDCWPVVGDEECQFALAGSPGLRTNTDCPSMAANERLNGAGRMVCSQ
jgi:hypothetical protein